MCFLYIIIEKDEVLHIFITQLLSCFNTPIQYLYAWLNIV